MPQVIAAAGAVLSSIGAAITSATAAATSATIAAVAAATGSIATGIAVGNALYAVGTGIAALFGASGFVAAVNAWSTVALLASTALRPSSIGRGPGGTQVDLQADTRSGIPLILGRSGTAGKIVHANTSGQENKNVALFYLLALTGGPITRFESLTCNDFPITLGGAGNEVAIAPPQFANSMLVSFTPGAKPDPQAYYPPGVELPWVREWSDAHRLSGVACAWWTLVYMPEAFPTGVPKPLFVIEGPAVYDPRGDSTYPGGSGPQRWNDEATWSAAGIFNPYLQALTWAIGRRDNGVLTFGVGAPIEAIDVPAFVEGANVADANGWTVGGEVLSTDRKWDVLRTMLQAGGGEPVKLAGKLSCHVRAPRVTLATLTGADVIGDVSITGSKRRRDRFNQIIPSYRSEDHRWEIVPAGAVTVDAYVAADGGVRSREGAYLLVQEAKQAAELAAYDIVDAREFEPIVLPVGPRFAGFKPGDCVLIDEPEFGMISQQVIVQTRELDPTSGRVTFTCRSETPGKHDYALGRVASPPPIPGLAPTDPSYVARPDAGTWTATGGILAGPDGSSVPAIVVTGSVTDPNVASVIVEHRLQLSPGVFGEWGSGEYPRSTRRVEIRAVIAASTYNVRVRYRSVRGVESGLVLDLGLVLTGSMISGGVTHIGGMTPNDLIEEINKIEGLENQYVVAVSTPPGAPVKHIAGIKLAATPEVSAAVFLADEIGFTNGIDNVYPLAVVGNKVIATQFQADDIKANTITTDKIVANNIDVTVRGALPAAVSINVTSPTLVMYTFFSTVGGYVDVDVWGNVSLLSGGSIGCMFDLWFDGVHVETFGNYAFAPVAYNTVFGSYRHRPPVGAHTYAVYGYKQSGGGPPTVDRMFMTLTENKTQA